MRRLSLLLLLLCLIFPGTVSLAADFTGEFKGDKLSAEIKPDGDNFTGSIHLGSNTFPLKAHTEEGKLVGNFTSQGHDFPFTAKLDGDSMSLISGTTTYTMNRKPAAPINPLEAAATPSTPADANDPASVNKEGKRYLDGDGVDKDYSRALSLFHKAADAGNDSAMANIGYMYQNGYGVDQDAAQAIAWYRKSADAGNPTAMDNLGFMYEKGNGVPADTKQAMAWYQKAADAGNASAMNDIGMLYFKATGPGHDDRKALEWFNKAADAGNADGLFDAGFMYENGRGTIKDLNKAKMAYKMAVEKGSTDAQARLDVLANLPSTKPAMQDAPVVVRADSGASEKSGPLTADQPRTFTLKSGEKVVLELGTGDVEVTGWDKPQVQVSMKLLIAADNEGNSAFIKNYKNDLAHDDGEVRLKGYMPPDANGNVVMSTSATPIKYSVMVPTNAVPVKIKSDMGEITINGVTGGINVESEMGQVTVTLPASTAAKIDATGGTVHTDFNVAGSKDDKSIHGTINGGGGAPIVIKSEMGKIDIRKQ